MQLVHDRTVQVVQATVIFSVLGRGSFREAAKEVQHRFSPFSQPVSYRPSLVGVW